MKTFDPHAVNELRLCAENDGDLHEQRLKPIALNLIRKLNKGTYDHTKAPKAWLNAFNDYRRVYNRRYGPTFSLADAQEAARQFADEWLAETCATLDYETPKGVVR